MTFNLDFYMQLVISQLDKCKVFRDIVNVRHIFLDIYLKICYQLTLGVYRPPGLQLVELLDVVVPQHGGRQLGVQHRVVPRPAQHPVLGVH